jgi:hypothetical protein
MCRKCNNNTHAMCRPYVENVTIGNNDLPCAVRIFPELFDKHVVVGWQDKRGRYEVLVFNDNNYTIRVTR